MIKNVLLVDDDPTMLLLIAEFLKFPPHIHLMTTESLESARNLCDNHPIDLVICDFHLGDGNGKELLSFLLAKGSQTTFILFTGSSEILNPTDILTYSITGKDLIALKNTVQNLIPLMN